RPLRRRRAGVLASRWPEPIVRARFRRWCGGPVRTLRVLQSENRGAQGCRLHARGSTVLVDVRASITRPAPYGSGSAGLGSANGFGNVKVFSPLPSRRNPFLCAFRMTDAQLERIKPPNVSSCKRGRWTAAASSTLSEENMPESNPHRETVRLLEQTLLAF